MMPIHQTPPYIIVMEQLKQQDQQDPLNWTRGEFEIPSARACGADVGKPALAKI